jgi:hypothetical protein
MSLDDVFDDREAQASARVRSRQRGVYLIEGHKNFLLRFSGDADPAVLDP